MAKIEDLKASLAKAAEKVLKIKGTIGKHEVAAAKKLAVLESKGIVQRNYKDDGFYDLPWESKSLVQDHESKRREAKEAGRKLQDAEAIMANWQAKLDVAIENERFLNDEAPEVIKEFLARWKANVYDWHVKGYANYVELKQTLKDLKDDAEAAFRIAYPKLRTWGGEFDAYVKKEHSDVARTAAMLAGFGGLMAKMHTYRDEAERLAYLEDTLEQDRKAKMLDLVHRVNAVVGTINDASRLQISAKGNLDGIIVGTKAAAKIQTIGAGGEEHHIQCFHYRTLVHEYTEKAAVSK